MWQGAGWMAAGAMATTVWAEGWMPLVQVASFAALAAVNARLALRIYALVVEAMP